jgi:hypothetical protein
MAFPVIDFMARWRALGSAGFRAVWLRSQSPLRINEACCALLADQSALFKTRVAAAGTTGGNVMVEINDDGRELCSTTSKQK